MVDTTPTETADTTDSEPGSPEIPGEQTITDVATVRSRRLRSALLGLQGGAFATLVMTVFRMPISNSLPPTANFWAHLFGGEPDDYPIPAFVLHFAYGIAGGAVFGLIFDEPGGRTRAGIEFRDLARGLGYSLVFSLFGSRIVLTRLVGMDLERDEALIFHVGHAIYGIAIGAWLGSNR